MVNRFSATAKKITVIAVLHAGAELIGTDMVCPAYGLKLKMDLFLACLPGAMSNSPDGDSGPYLADGWEKVKPYPATNENMEKYLKEYKDHHVVRDMFGNEISGNGIYKYYNPYTLEISVARPLGTARGWTLYYDEDGTFRAQLEKGKTIFYRKAMLKKNNTTGTGQEKYTYNENQIVLPSSAKAAGVSRYSRLQGRATTKTGFIFTGCRMIALYVIVVGLAIVVSLWATGNLKFTDGETDTPDYSSSTDSAEK